MAATIGAVEASKDQLGLCRWNYMIRFVNQRIRNNVRSAAQANRFSSSSTIPLASCKDCDKAKQAEESLRTVMYLSCWGLNWWRQIDRDFYFCFAVDWIRQIVSMWRSCEIKILNRRYEFWVFSRFELYKAQMILVQIAEMNIKVYVHVTGKKYLCTSQDFASRQAFLNTFT